MKVLTIIPARGRSKGIPRKNIQPLAGKPLLAHSIEQARSARLVNRVVVSTDDAEIATISRQYGAEVIQRPSAISGDAASSESALQHAIEYLQQTESYTPDLIVFLQATSPIRLPADIDGAVEKLVEAGADSVFSACPEHFTGRWRIEDSGARPVNFDPERRPRRQEYPVEYSENGSIYVFRPRVLLEGGSRMGGRIGIYPMPAWRSFQIDTPEDFTLMEELYAYLRVQVPTG